MPVQVSNNAYSTLAAGITNTATSLTVATGEGVRFPAASSASGNYFYLTILDTSNNIEVVKVIERIGDVLTVNRGVDGTTARAFSVDSRLELRPTAALFNDLPIRKLNTADLNDATVTSAKLAVTGVVAGNYGGVGTAPTITVNSKGQITAIANASGYVQRDVYDYDSGIPTYTWAKPTSGGSLVRVQMWGGGGGGARCSSGGGGGGGGGGAYVEKWFDISELNDTATITVGNGGAGATTDNVEGAAGGSSRFNDGSTSFYAYRGGGGSANGTTTLGAWGGGGGGELEAGSSATNTTAGKGGAIGGGHGGQHNSGNSTAASTARGTESLVDGDIPATPAHMTNDARSIWGGGGGGGGNTGSVTGSEAAGGYAVWGGGGGGGGYNGTQANAGAKGGRSLFGGGGGDGKTASAVGADGAVPGGGGGGTETAVAGSGGAGRVIITVY